MADDRTLGFICGECGRFQDAYKNSLERYCPECRKMLERRGLLYGRNEPRPRTHA